MLSAIVMFLASVVTVLGPGISIAGSHDLPGTLCRPHVFARCGCWDVVNVMVRLEDGCDDKGRAIMS